MTAVDAQLVKELADRLIDLYDEPPDEPHIRAARNLSARLLREEPVIVEQGVLFKKGAAVPDGWSWTDIGPFTGKFSGIRLQKGEPCIEQKGHLLWLRSADAYTERQQPIYQLAASWERQSVMVVWGKLGARTAYLMFEQGQLGPVVPIDGSAELTARIVHWLEWTWENPIALG